LVHIADALLQTGLKGRDLVAHLLLLLFRCRVVPQHVFEAINAFLCLLAVIREALNFADPLHSLCHLHAFIHLVRDLCQTFNVVRRVVAQVLAVGVLGVALRLDGLQGCCFLSANAHCLLAFILLVWTKTLA